MNSMNTEGIMKNKPDINIFKKISAEGLDLDYAILFSEQEANALLQKLEDTVEYYGPDMSRVRVFGKWHEIPRQQVAYGDTGLIYKFSGTTVTAKPWNSAIEVVRNKLLDITGIKFNFALVNKYSNGGDHIGEHRDNEPELDHSAPIASVSFGAHREFKLRHRDARFKKRNVPPVMITLEHGSLLMMNPPTNQIWYHSLPVRKRVHDIRINLTFRKMLS